MVKIACHVGPRAQEDWPLEKTEEAPRRQQEAKLRGPIRRGTMSFGKGEFLSVEKVHKIKIAVARSVAAVRRLEVGCPVKEFFLRCLRYIPEVDAYRVDVIRVTNFDIALCKQL